MEPKRARCTVDGVTRTVMPWLNALPILDCEVGKILEFTLGIIDFDRSQPRACCDDLASGGAHFKYPTGELAAHFGLFGQGLA